VERRVRELGVVGEWFGLGMLRSCTQEVLAGL
jgi:hypothetical protein